MSLIAYALGSSESKCGELQFLGTLFAYGSDASGRAVTTTSIRYDGANQPQRISDGRTWRELRYNRFGQVMTETDMFRRVVRREYDGVNRLSAVTAADGTKTCYTYNENGQLVRMERLDGETRLSLLDIAYGGDGLPVKYTDGRGRSKSFDRDAFGRVVRERFPDATEVEYGYNALGQLSRVIDQNGNEIRFSWDRFGLKEKATAANQLTDYVYDETGLLREILSKYRGEEKVDRKIAREYDALDRLIKVTYDGRDVETYSYDSWGKVISSSRNGRKASYRYDYFGRLVEKNEDGVITRSSYNAWGQRTGRETVNGSLKLTETREYDALGRLSKIRNGSGGELTYHYDNLNRLVKQTVNGVPVEYSYDKYGRLVRKALMGFSGSPAVSELKYFYDPDGTIIAREVNGVRQAYKYDRRGQLLEVVGQERYAYDPAGNILSKTVNGVTTTYRYDRANQLVSSETEGKVTKYAYDAAGRLVKEGNKSYTYAWLDKLVSVSEAGKVSANFSYHFDGQIAGVTYADGRRENYLWDGLALIHRDGTELLNEPAVTGGNPVLSGDKVLFNDMLGNTLGVKGKDSYQPIKMTAFGESDNVDAFFTGKPLVGELGYAFLFRNYRPEQGKWQTADPLGYPDGWNNFAYVNNGVTMAIDWLGGATHSGGNVTYGSAEITSISYNTPDKGGSTGSYIYTNGIVVSITARRSVTYEVMCPDNCEMNGTTMTTYEYMSASSLVPNSVGEIVPGIPSPMGFNPIAIPTSVSQAAYEAAIQTIVSTLIDAAISSNFTNDTQQKINTVIDQLVRSGNWSKSPIDFGKCQE